MVNHGAALCDNLVIFGTLDAQLVALDQGTGKVVWRQKIDDFKTGEWRFFIFPVYQPRVI
jgi:alcohol dehydrogenase (cytochrome c)